MKQTPLRIAAASLAVFLFFATDSASHALVLISATLVQAPSFPEVSALPERLDLPDPLLMQDGRPVTSQEKWVKERRPELKALFQHYMYGNLPPAPKIDARPGKTYKDFFSGKATMKEVTIAFGPPAAPKIYLILFIPNNRKGRAPTILGLNFCGNHTVVADPRVSLPQGWIASLDTSSVLANIRPSRTTGRSFWILPTKI